MAPENHAQLTPCSNLEPRQLLEYVPAHHIVICKVCSYAIQPLAISRHLKNYHQIYRGTRRPFMRYVASLDLREPQDVVIRTIPEDPIPFLPVVNGFACCIPNCRYISISVKLMTTHCNNKHQTIHQTDARWRHARLQTFFKGNRTKYFEVSQTDPGQGWSGSRNSKERTQDINDTDGLPGAYRISPCPDGNATNGLNLDTVDLALLQHFRESTYSSLSSDPLVQKIWRTVVPEMAYTNLYLMQGLLACSALHLADLQPARRRELTIRAVSHQDKALPLFRAVIPGINDLNCHAAYAFCHLLIIFAYASQDKAKYFSLAQQDLENDTSSYLHLIHGGCSILISVKSVISTGPLRWLIPDNGHADNSTYCEDSRLKSLGFLSSLEPDDAWQGMAPAVYLDAFFKLRTTFHRAYTRGALLTIWDIVHAWPAQVPDDFLRLLSDEHPGALILLAHYCILLRRLESYWYMKGYAAGLLSRIQSRIGQKWYNWIAWPLQDVGMEERSIEIHPESQHLRMTDQS